MTWCAHLLCGWPFALLALFAVFLFGWFEPIFGPPARRLSYRLVRDLMGVAVVVAWIIYMANMGLWRSCFPLWMKIVWIVGIGAVGILIVGGGIALIIARYMPS